MIPYPQFNPVALQIGPVAIHWYGITYLVAFVLFIWLGAKRVKLAQFASRDWSRRDIEDLLFYGVLGVVLGGRIGYVLFYKPGYYAGHLLEVFAVWKGGMSFHGGMLGVIVAMLLFARSRNRQFFDVTDLIAPCVPTGLGAGRIGNFINGELPGRVADAGLPWGMVYPNAGPQPRHPSSLYQFLLEGVVLFVVLWIYAKKPRGLGQVSGAFLIGYGVVRFVSEFFREPDDFLGLLALGLSMGQWLCIPMIVAGIAIWVWGRGRQPRAD
jgi:phosphatidylglycerol:prolipoprotein diacylglycerol transferase